ncbi:DUF5753 domain-containing protein [Actinokineospora sp.]|uniref:DUF5753 domain-containing protein n=1 Tax=Actinokineospora sp. TaxID=1872133 RepID=UPI003D6A2415
MSGQHETTSPPRTRRSWRDRFCAVPPRPGRSAAVRERLADEARGHGDADLERAATRIVVVDFSLVPALARAADYSRHLVGLTDGGWADPESVLTDRIRRQAVLYDPAKTIEILVGESALRYPPCPPRIRRAQSARLTAMLCLRRVRLGIIPLNAELPTIVEHGYSMFDDLVVVDINHTEVTITDPRDVALYERITAALWRAALDGAAARTLLRRMGR